MKAEYLNHFGDDLMAANCARTSFDKWKAEFDEKDAKLIDYLARNEHINPFFHPQAQFRVTAPIFIARQWFRSTVGVARSEVSRRYVDTPPEFFQPDQWRARPTGGIKQGSGESLDVRVQYRCEQTYANAIHQCEKAYEALLAWDVAPEQARMVLPQSMYTTWVETGSVYAFARICKLRVDHHAQKEIQDLASQVSDVMAQKFPVSWKELMK